MAQVTVPGSELFAGDRFVYNSEVLTIVRADHGRVIRTGERFVFVYFADGTSLCYAENDRWYVTVFE